MSDIDDERMSENDSRAEQSDQEPVDQSDSESNGEDVDEEMETARDAEEPHEDDTQEDASKEDVHMAEQEEPKGQSPHGADRCSGCLFMRRLGSKCAFGPSQRTRRMNRAATILQRQRLPDLGRPTGPRSGICPDVPEKQVGRHPQPRRTGNLPSSISPTSRWGVPII